MRRSLAAATAIALVLVGAAAGTSNAKPRRYKVERSDSMGYVGARGSSGADPEVFLDEAVFETEAHERSVSLEIRDRTGQAVAAFVRQDTDADGTWDLDEAICGSSGAPVAIDGGTPVVVKVQPGPCADGTPAAMTSGTIAATFTGYVRKAPAQVVPSFCRPAAPRDVTKSYQSPAGVGAGEASYPLFLLETSESEAAGGASFRGTCSDGRVDVTVADKSGLATRAAVGVDPDGTGPRPEELTEICGSTEQPIEILPGASVNVYVVGGPCTDGTPAAATTGTITATFLAP